MISPRFTHSVIDLTRHCAVISARGRQVLVLLQYYTLWAWIRAHKVISQLCLFAKTLSRCCSEYIATQGCLGLMAETGMVSIFGEPCMLFEEGLDFRAWRTKMLHVLRWRGRHRPLYSNARRPRS